MKTCIRCGSDRPATLEFFPPSRLLKSGFCGHCRECDRKGKAASKAVRRDDLLKQRRDAYAADGGAHHRLLEGRRRERDPIQARAEILRDGVRNRVADKGLDADAECLSVALWYGRIDGSRCCPCCGVIFDLSPRRTGAQRHRDNSPSVDRLDPSKGYTVANTAVICWRCNNIKRNFSSRDLRIVAEWMDAVAGKSEETLKDVVIKE